VRVIRRTATRMGMLLGVLAAGLLAMPSISMAAPQPPRPLQDSVTGSGVASNCGGDGRVAISARSGPSGENPTGQVTCGALFGGPVTCLSVSGNVALLITGSIVFGPVAVRVTDNGTSDRLQAFPTSFAPGGGCPMPLSAYADFPFTGDLVVVDAPPSPTSKEQCKNGGFAQFGFKNQGACVAFVQHGPKP
jgi:hypothetical protein